MKKAVMALIAGILFASSCFAVGVTPYNQGMEYNSYLTAVTIVGTKDVGGCESFIITTNGSDATFEAKWYRDNATTLISTEVVAQGTLTNVKTKKVKIYAYPTTASTPEVYVYFR